ncbi:hypothetical protein ACFPM3_21855 [Streptomyces coeruleoprunus]|uniref:Lipoprotein n=1 Tax=Streptomyces coeruleoprunus TaxID=285563 RepID=A0ABV9XIE3_9ACTN
MPVPPSRAPFAVPLGLGLLLLTGCGASPSTPAAPATPTSDPVPAAPSRVQEADGTLTRDAERYLFLAEGHLVSRCMARQGFAYVVRTPPEAALAGAPPVDFGAVDPADARTRGYGPVPHTDGSTSRFVAEDPNRAYAKGLSPKLRAAYEKALFGDRAKETRIALPDGESITTNPDGCTADVRRALYGGDLAAYLRNDYIENNLDRAVLNRMAADPARDKALGAWKRCMKDRDRPFDDPGAARSAAWKTRKGDRPTATETAIAVADAECRVTSRLTTVLQQLDRTYRARLTRERAAQVNANRATRAEAVRRAGRLLAER